ISIPLKRVLRKTMKQDYLDYKKNVADAKEALITCKKLIKKHGLDMNLIDANFTLDRQQLLFRFSADERIDFRKLVKDLAAIYRTRIELRQIGVRDKAGEVGGLGPCGRPLCCSQFLYNFDIVSINMAKNQNIALNPSKINGLCGRLLCCLTYENEEYIKSKKGLPNVGDKIKLKEGKGEVIAVDILKREYKVDISNYGVVNVKLD
ncbi:MAG: regulatory iron-sulfur-containing complex subunit RicT, partial [Bacilli bacterium]|nr:regulatory iron-sulfur-containing complex subunit RicT [Bacilli bacterium]